MYGSTSITVCHIFRLRRSLGAALSSLWSPREDKDSKSVHANNHDEHVKLDSSIQENMNSKENVPLRRKVGVSYSVPSQILDSGSIDTTETPKSDSDSIKRRRFSGSFRERTRNFRIQMRRRSGTWYTAADEKGSDLDITSSSNPTVKVSSVAVSPFNGNSKTRSSFVSIFSKRRSKHFDDEVTEPVTRRRSECNSRIDPDELLDRQLSTSISAPIITYPPKDCKESTVSEVISEENLENETELSGLDSKNMDVDNGKSPCAQNLVSNGSSTLLEDSDTCTSDKKHKKGKIMKTIRNIIRKGKN